MNEFSDIELFNVLDLADYRIRNGVVLWAVFNASIFIGFHYSVEHRPDRFS